jgi:hypothetical protein
MNPIHYDIIIMGGFLLGVLFCLSWVIGMTDFGTFGKYDKGKLIAFMRVYTNLYIVAGISLIIITRQLNLIGQDLFLALLLAGLSVLGFNLSASTKKIEKLPPDSQNDPPTK